MVSNRAARPAGRLMPFEAPRRIGSEYGEGFSQLGLGGAHQVLDVQALNTQLRVLGAERMRHALFPDAAYGMVFTWEGAVAYTRNVQRRTWKRLAEELGLWFPPRERSALYSVSPERAITDVLQWTADWGVARRYAMRLAEIYRAELASCPTGELLVPGVAKWLLALQTAKVPCVLVSSLDRLTLDSILERAGLGSCFNAFVTADDDMETISESLLSAAIKIGRPPNHCVAFTGTADGLAAAHNCTMKAVGVVGAHRSFELKSADVTVASMDELSVVNIRRMFANVGSEFMDLSLDRVGYHDKPPGHRRTTNALMDDGEKRY